MNMRSLESPKSNILIKIQDSEAVETRVGSATKVSKNGYSLLPLGIGKLVKAYAADPMRSNTLIVTISCPLVFLLLLGSRRMCTIMMNEQKNESRPDILGAHTRAVFLAWLSAPAYPDPSQPQI